MKEATFVYCIQERSRDALAPIKVGVAENIPQRLNNLQVGNPMVLAIYGVIGPFTRSTASRIENDLHATMSKHRIRGEWFTGHALPIFDAHRDRYATKRNLAMVANG